VGCDGLDEKVDLTAHSWRERTRARRQGTIRYDTVATFIKMVACYS